MNAQGYYNELTETDETALALNPDLQSIIDAPLPAVRNSHLRAQPRKEWAKAVRQLVKDMKLTGIGVTTPSYSMASTISISLPDILADDREHQKLHESLYFDNHKSIDCPVCAQRQQARKHIKSIILAAFPDLDDRSEYVSDYFDYCLSVD